MQNRTDEEYRVPADCCRCYAGQIIDATVECTVIVNINPSQTATLPSQSQKNFSKKTFMGSNLTQSKQWNIPQFSDSLKGAFMGSNLTHSE